MKKYIILVLALTLTLATAMHSAAAAVSVDQGEIYQGSSTDQSSKERMSTIMDEESSHQKDTTDSKDVVEPITPGKVTITKGSVTTEPGKKNAPTSLLPTLPTKVKTPLKNAGVDLSTEQSDASVTGDHSTVDQTGNHQAGTDQTTTDNVPTDPEQRSNNSITPDTQDVLPDEGPLSSPDETTDANSGTVDTVKASTPAVDQENVTDTTDAGKVVDTNDAHDVTTADVTKAEDKATATDTEKAVDKITSADKSNTTDESTAADKSDAADKTTAADKSNATDKATPADKSNSTDKAQSTGSTKADTLKDGKNNDKHLTDSKQNEQTNKSSDKLERLVDEQENKDTKQSDTSGLQKLHNVRGVLPKIMLIAKEFSNWFNNFTKDIF